MEDSNEHSVINQDHQNIRFEPLTVQCRQSRSRFQFINYFLEWLICWPDPYKTSIFPLIWALGGMVIMLVDMGTDLWVAKTHYNEGHLIWTYMTIAFFFLPIVFALGYTVLLRRFQRWYQVHPIGPFYWSFKTVQAHKRQTSYQIIETPDEANSFIHYTHEISRCDTRNRFASADESYLESFPECILQAYFIARLWSRPNPEDDLNQITWNMWLSVGVSAVSLVGYESTVAYNRHFASTVLEPSICDIAFRIILDLMCVLPRLAAIACYSTVNPKTVTVPCFLIIHIVIVYLWMRFSDARKKSMEDDNGSETVFEEYRGYTKHSSNSINYLRATVVSFLFPPTCSWHLHEVAQKLPGAIRPSSLNEIRSGLPLQFWVISIFQFLESALLFGLWLYYTHKHTTELYQILVPTMSLTLLLIRPFCDVLCQMLILTPFAEKEAVDCIRFKGVVAKTRILEMGSDIVNSLAAELLPRLHNLELLFSESFTDRSRAVVKKECQFIASNFTPDKIIKRHRKQRTHTMTPKTNKVTTSPGPKTENLFIDVGQKDMELLQNVLRAAGEWQLLDATAEEYAVELRNFINRCEDRVQLWEEVFVLCLNHQLLPSRFYVYTQTDTEASGVSSTIYADYTKLILLNKRANSAITFSNSQRSASPVTV